MSDISQLREIVEEQRERRETLRNEIQFERCEQTKKIGEYYRDGSLVDVSSEFDISYSKTRALVVDYIKLVNHPTGNVPLESILIGVRFYGGQYSFEEILEEMDVSEKEAQTSIREFVAVTLAEQEQDIDLRSTTISEDTQYPPSLREAVSVFGEVENQVREYVSSSISSIGPQVSSMINDMRESFRPLIESLQELATQVREAIEYGISNFESPKDYKPQEVRLSTVAQAAGAQFLEEVLEDMKNVENHPLDPYRNRLETGIQDFQDERYYAPVFVFISVQDGLMHWLCQEDGVPADDTNRFNDPVYDWNTKRDTLGRLNQEWYGVSTGDFMNNLEAFYAHRNVVMHGDPLAYFDENIATVSLLFLAMTLDTALNYGDS